ncbi:MAG: hypothetical protein ABIK37_03460 [candidate division WOR-3 bacterium]
MELLRVLLSNIGLKILALVLAVLLWVYAALDRSYDVTVTVPVVAVRRQSGEAVVTDVDVRSAEVTLTGKGRDLLRVRAKQLGFRPSVPEGRTGTRQVKLAAADLKLPSGVIARAIEPEQVELKLSPAMSRTVNVLVPTRGQVGSGMTVVGLTPLTTVTIVGPAEALGLFSSVATETLNLSTVARDCTLRLGLAQPVEPGVSLDPDTVAVEVRLAREGAKIFLGVPVKVVAPPTIQVELDPEEAQIAVAGPAAKLDSLTKEQVSARIKIAGLKPGEHRLAAEIVLPPGFRLVKCEPQLFDITIR